LELAKIAFLKNRVRGVRGLGSDWVHMAPPFFVVGTYLLEIK
jgi:hypothetical protein